MNQHKKFLHCFLAAIFCTCLLSVNVSAQDEAVAAEGAEGPTIEEAYKNSESLMAEERWAEANSVLSQLILTMKNEFGQKASSYKIAFYSLRGECNLKQKDYAAAFNDYTVALNLVPEYAPALNGRAEVYIEQGQIEAAYEDLMKAVEIDRKNGRYIFNLGKIQVLSGVLSVGVKSLDTAIELDDSNAEAYRFRAQGHAGLGDYEESHIDFKKSLAIDSEQYETYFSQGQVYLLQEEFSKAIKSLSESIEHYVPEEGSKDPYSQGYLTLASAYEEVAKKAESKEERKAGLVNSLAQCNTLLKALPKLGVQHNQVRAAAYYRRGIAQRLMKRYGEAVKSFSKAIDNNPELSEAYFRRGIVFHYMGEAKLAAGDFTQASTINYTDPRAPLWLGFTMANEGEYYKAITAYSNSIAQNARFVPAYVNRGLAYLQVDEYDQAISDFNEAIRLESSEATHYYRRGVVYSLMKKHQKAVDSFSNAIAFNSKYAEAYKRLGEELQAMGQGSLAAQYFKKAAALGAGGR